METRYVTLEARYRCVPRAEEQASGGGVLYETRLEHRSEVPKAPVGGGKVLDLEEYRRRLAKQQAVEEEPEEEPSPAPAPATRRERLMLLLDGVATAALIAVAAGLLLAVWSWM